MWPWAHLSVGYVCYSLLERVRAGAPPTQWNALVLAVATQMPDLIDKPLAWQFQVIASGVGVAHSLLVGVPSALLVGLALRWRGRPGAGAAVVVGHTTHVLGDLLFGGLFGRGPLLPAFLWPVYSTAEPESPGVAFRVWDLLLASKSLLGTPAGRVYFLLEVAFVLGTVGLWVLDGMPGLRPWQPDRSSPDSDR